MAAVTVLLAGSSLNCDRGNIAYCGVYLITAVDVDGSAHRILFDFGHVGRRPHLLAALRARNLTPADIDTVVLSHGHWDHIQNVDLFSASTVLIHADELEYCNAPLLDDFSTPPWTAALLHPLAPVPVADGMQIAAGVEVLHLPGHTRGSIGLRVQTDDGIAVVTGDAVPSGPAARAAAQVPIFWSAEQALDSARRAVGLAGLVYPGHDRPFRIAGDRVDYLDRIEPVVLTAVDLDQTSFSFAEKPPDVRTVFAGSERWRPGASTAWSTRATTGTSG
jgi:glyoxylase-like metal-dependent hydrolase (beta-lactamase superfamily II)